MASVGDILTVWKNISRLMTTVLDLENNSSLLSIEFQDEVKILCDILESYNDEIRNINEPDQKIVLGILNKAQNLLNGVTPRLSNLREMQENIDNSCCCSYGWWLYAKLNLFFLPEKLERTLKKVIDEINRIPEVLKKQKEFIALAGPSRSNIYTTFYDNNNFYVHIKESGRDVIAAIDNDNGPRIVLLHGGVGTGKSTLARYVCTLYGEEGENKGLFKHAILVVCGGNRSKLIPSIKQYEIAQFLSSRGSSSSPENRGTSQQERIENDLQKLLGEDKILIILDDVADPEFFKKMWDACRRNKQVKFLITSQKSDLCRLLESDSLAIEMGEPTMEEARKIVASLVGLQDKIIPDNLKDVADAMIKATGRNPLALACLTSKFTKGGHQIDKTAWVEALRRLKVLLGEQEKIGVYGEYHASPGVWAAMELCLNSLESAEAKDILSLMYACKGDSIPEEVLKIWCQRVPRIPNTSSLFFDSIDELSTRQLLKSIPGTVMPEMRTWSLRPLLKLYIDLDMFPKKKLGPLFAALLGGDNEAGWFAQKMKSWFADRRGYNRAGPNLGLSVKDERSGLDNDSEEIEREKTRVAAVLCALYFDPAHTNNVVTGVVTRALNLLNNPNDPIYDLRRKAVEPIIWLLDKLEARREPEDGTWTQADKSCVTCVRQAFLEYECEQQLDDKSICVLLELTSYPVAPVAVLTALGSIFEIEEKPLLDRDQLGFLTRIVEILGSTDPIEGNIREAASNALIKISDKAIRENKTLTVLRTRGLLPVLVSLLENSISNSVQSPDDLLPQNAAGTLWNLAYGNQDLVKSQIVNEPGALASLVGALSKDSDPLLQDKSSGALMCLAAGGETVASRIGSQAGALAGLVAALSKDQNPALQRHAAKALSNLAAGGETIKSQIVSQAGALAGLVIALSKHEKPPLQKYAAAAFSNLALGGEAIKTLIVSEAGTIPGLVTALSKDDNPALQTYAARAFCNLATGGEEIKSQIVRQAGARAGLLKALCKDKNPALQTYAAGAFSNLAAGGEEIKSQIVSQTGILTGLVPALSKDVNPGLQEYAAGAFVNLAAGGETIKSLIVGEAGAVAGLVAVLSKDQNPALQKYAAQALSNLAVGGEEIKSQIVSQAGVLEGLVTALSKDANPPLQTYATGAVFNLAAGEETIKSAIVSEAGALAALVTALSKNQNPVLQEYAAGTFFNLAARGEAIKSKIVSEAGALASLVTALSKDQNPALRDFSAGAFFNLAFGGEQIKSEIVSQAGALAGLVMALSKDEHFGLQKSAAGAFSNLAAGDEKAKSQIVSEPGALAGLVTLLCKDENLALQEFSAGAFLNLAAGGETIKSGIVSEAGALAGLLRALSKDENPTLQAYAALAFSNLAVGGDTIKSKIVDEAGVLPGLVTALAKDENRALQGSAAGALCKLAGAAYIYMLIKSGIVNEAGALAALVTAMSKDENPALQKYALVAFCNLAAGGATIKSRSVSESGALAGLVTVLSKDESIELQIFATIALSFLASGEDTVKLQILEEGRALARLVKLFVHDNTNLQQYVRMALANLARGCPGVQSKVFAALDSLQNQDSSVLRERAGLTLVHLNAQGLLNSAES